MHDRAAPAPPFDVALCVLSWKAHATLRASLASLRNGGILGDFAERILYFNEIDDTDRAIAAEHDFRALGTAANVGIAGGMQALAEAATARHVLFLENDCPLNASREAFRAMMASALADMAEHGAPVFSMRSRREPGDKFDRGTRYAGRFRVLQPFGARAPVARVSGWQRAWEDWRRPRLRACALFAEEHPDVRHPTVIRRTERGNWLTSSRHHNWSNNCVLVERRFFLDQVCRRVREHPAPSTVNGHQDVEAALKLGGWWEALDVPLGQSEPGPFTHHRLDR